VDAYRSIFFVGVLLVNEYEVVGDIVLISDNTSEHPLHLTLEGYLALFGAPIFCNSAATCWRKFIPPLFTA
jgi:hypothetical protein